MVFAHDGRPLSDGISVISSSSIFGVVYDVAAAPGGVFWAATLNGVYRTNSSGSFEKVDSITVDARTITAEDDSTIWIGTASAGVVQYSTDSSTTRTYTTSNGLISNTVNSIALDRVAGNLWIGTDNGVSKLSLGYVPGTMATGDHITVVPNPYSLSRDGGAGRAITFRGCPAGSMLTIYTLTGKPLAHATLAVPSPYGGTISWVPAPSQVPGSYFFSIPKAKQNVGKVLIIP